MSFTVDRINTVHDALMSRAAKLQERDPLQQQLQQLAGRAEEIRKKIVATKEGGAVTGELRIREKASEVYGALLSYEGRPTDYYLSRTDSLKRELEDVTKEFDSFTAREVQQMGAPLQRKHLQPIHQLTREEWEKTNSDSEGSAGGASQFFSEFRSLR